MSPPLAIVMAGRTEASVRARRGDFEDWFLAGLGIAPSDALVVPVFEGADLPAPDAISGCVVTGSSAMVTDRAEWSVRLEAWLPAVMAVERPVLAICYGHQLLAEALGGAAGWNPNGREIGTTLVELAPAAREDLLLSGLPQRIAVLESHSQSVLRLPPAAVKLAGNDHDPLQGFRVGAHTWSFQFHPEFDADIVAGYLEARRREIEAEGLDVDALVAALADGPAGRTILERFGRLVGARSARR